VLSDGQPGRRLSEGLAHADLEPVRWVGWRQVGKKKMRLWSCEGHAEGLEDLRPVSRPMALSEVHHRSGQERQSGADQRRP
jgi:hypothetical protein